jgi:alpha-D-xyloside xylohydrolase
MKILGLRKLDEFAVIETSKGMMKLQAYSANVIRVVYTLEERFSSKESLSVLPREIHEIYWDVNETENAITMLTDSVKIEISKATGAFTYLDAYGNLLVKEPPRGGKTLVKVDVLKTVFDETSEARSEKSVDGMRALADSETKVVDRQAFHTKLEFLWAEDEALYGLGSHEEGMMNLRGHHQYLYQQNMKAVVPVLVSTKGYGILFDSYSLMTFHDDAFGSYIWTDVDDEMDYYFIHGPELDQIVHHYRTLTGKMPMLPKWSFGYVQSKERYKTQEEMIGVVKEYRDRKIPLDLIVLDWRSWKGELWGQKTFDEERFPDPEGMMKQLHDMNAKMMISIWPIMREGGENRAEMKKNGYLLGNQATYDSFNEKARELYWKHADDGLFSKGVDSWWCDCTEPFEADWKGEVKPEPEERLLINTGESKKYLDPAYINAYSLLHSKGIYEGQRKTTDRKRVVNLTRSAFAGQHRYAAITWSGDTAAKWETLRRQIPDGLNFCCTGEPYWTMDIGAFFVGGIESWRKVCGDENAPGVWFWDGDYEDGCNDLGYRELYVRWFQFGAFLPMFRSHGTDTPREVWRFGEPGTRFYDSLIRTLDLRYRLIPYIYSLAGRVTLEDYTMMRALAFDFREDASTFDISDQFMFGPAFLVNPVIEPMYYEKNSMPLENVRKTRSAYLPKGCGWYDFWTGRKYGGGNSIDAEAPIDIIPLFIKAGSIIPMGPKIQYTGEKPDSPIELRIYPGADGEFTIYEDEGDNYNYEKGAFATIRIHWEDRSRHLTLDMRQGSYDEMSQNKVFHIVLVSEKGGFGLDEASGFDWTVEYEGKALVVEL